MKNCLWVCLKITTERIVSSKINLKDLNSTWRCVLLGRFSYNRTLEQATNTTEERAKDGGLSKHTSWTISWIKKGRNDKIRIRRVV